MYFVGNRSIFSGIHDVQLEKADESEGEDESEFASDSKERSGDRSRNASSMSAYAAGGSSTPPPKIDKRLAQVHVSISFIITSKDR